MLRARRGFTLWELTIVLALIALGSAIVIPNWVDLDTTAETVSGNALVTLLRDARRVAIEQSQTVAVRIDPGTRYFRVDTTGVSGTGVFADGTLEFSAYESLETELTRLQFVFQPTGAALGDSVLMRGSEGPILVAVDPWSGQAVMYAR